MIKRNKTNKNMKVYYLFSILLVVLATTFAKNIVNKRAGVNSKSKRDATSDECKYINNWLGKDESFKCCYYDAKSNIICNNGHITEMYFFFF